MKNRRSMVMGLLLGAATVALPAGAHASSRSASGGVFTFPGAKNGTPSRHLASTPNATASAGNSTSSCVGSHRIALSLASNTTSSTSPSGTFSYRDNRHNVFISHFQISSLVVSGTGSADSGNTATIYGHARQNGVRVSVEIDVYDYGASMCSDYFQLYTSTGYTSGYIPIAKATVTG